MKTVRSSAQIRQSLAKTLAQDCEEGWRSWKSKLTTSSERVSTCLRLSWRRPTQLIRLSSVSRSRGLFAAEMVWNRRGWGSKPSSDGWMKRRRRWLPGRGVRFWIISQAYKMKKTLILQSCRQRSSVQLAGLLWNKLIKNTQGSQNTNKSIAKKHGKIENILPDILKLYRYYIPALFPFSLPRYLSWSWHREKVVLRWKTG